MDVMQDFGGSRYKGVKEFFDTHWPLLVNI